MIVPQNRIIKRKMKNWFPTLSRRNLIAGFCVILGVLLLGVFLGGVNPGFAQGSGDEWSVPENLSQSGGTKDPLLVVDSEGQFHTLWIDENLGSVYTTSEDGIEWSEPTPVELPSKEIKPKIVADNSGFIHIFWLGDVSEVTGGLTGTGTTGTGTTEDTSDDLFYSRVNSNNFGDSAAWSSPLELSDSAVALDFALDSSGNLHLVYVRRAAEAGEPAGLYYTRLLNERSTWSEPVLLFESAYFRTLTFENAHADIDTASTAEGEYVYVAWDNRPRERVYFIKSADGGETWGVAEEMDQPQEGTAAPGPSNIMVYARNEEVLLLWQSAHTESSCNQYFQWSIDRGETWQARQQMFEDLLICPQQIQFFEGSDGPILMVTAIQMFLQTWDGTHWSDPQLQASLTSFVDPETQKLVDFSCREGALVGEGELYVVGCDQGLGKDIWILKRQIGDISSWFPEDPLWNPFITIESSVESLNYPVLVADNSERIHAFWSQPIDPASGRGETGIYYSRWEAGQWSPSGLVLSSQSGNAIQPAAAVGSGDTLYVVWSGSETGEIYFSKASAARAAVASTWTSPVALPAVQAAASSPEILIDHDGKIYVAYAIPLNEGRGIYLTSSTDSGANWSEPQMVFDAAGAGWAIVDHPRLGLTKSDNLHVLWTRYSLPSGPGPIGLYYSRSEDSGLNWSEPQLVVEEAIAWDEVVGFGDRTVHRIWQEFNNGVSTLWHENSVDDGLTWTRVSPVSIFGETVQQPSLTWDSAGRLHLLLVVSRTDQDFALQHWMWDGSRWSSDRTLELNSDSISTLNDLVASMSPQGVLSLLFSVNSGTRGTGDPVNYLLLTNRVVDLPRGEPTPPSPPQVTPAAQNTPEPTERPEPTSTQELVEPTPTIDFNTIQPQNRPTNFLFIIGLTLGGLFLVGLVALVVIQVQSGRIRF
jgi:hypothetical protein